MTQSQEIRRLQTLAQLMLDQNLTRLRQSADAKLKSERALADLSEPLLEVCDLNGAAAGLVSLNYQRWADQRKAALNQTLALQTHDWLVARDSAKIAFGKAEAITRIARDLQK